jgi:L-glyceraldehyde 3-phosphate reductase
MKLSGKRLSKISLGLSQLNNSLYKEKNFIYSKSDIKNIIDFAIDKNITCFDTASNYGDTEKILGSFPSNKKNKIIISTKSGFVKNNQRNFSQKYLLSQIHNSLKALKTDSIDVFFLNKPSKIDIEENNLIFFFEKIKKEGLVNSAGIVISEKALEDKYLISNTFECYSFLYNLINTDLEDAIKLTKKYKKTNFCRSPLNSGLLTNTFGDNFSVPKSDFRYSYFNGKNFETKIKKIEKIKFFLSIKNDELMEASTEFVKKNKNIDSVIFGSKSIEQVDNLLKIYKRRSYYTNQKYTSLKKRVKTISKIFKTIDQKK